jgi:hypothetical protein
MRKLIQVLVVLVLLGALPAGAATWGSIRNQDCTGLHTATATIAGTAQPTNSAMCCSGAGAGFCEGRDVPGAQFLKSVTLLATGSYTVGGDPVYEQALRNLQMDVVTNWSCQLVLDNTGATIRFPMMVRNGGNSVCTASVTPLPCCTGNKVGTCGTQGQGTTVKLFTASGVEQTVASIAGFTLACQATGY